MSQTVSAVSVRLAEGSDVPKIGHICDRGFRFVSSALLPSKVVDELAGEFYSEERISGEVDPAGFTPSWQGYVVAEVDGEVVGAAGGGLVAEGVGQLYVIYLELDRRGLGIGSRLLEYVTEQQRALGATTQKVAVLADNEHGLPFYLARGFNELERRLYPGGHPAAVPELVLQRELEVPARATAFEL
ncbi:GNAT family N-acetyltransferase [Nocardioides bruguierae]|uniref:GNAT family N-acetyltransferase n=1 Tax=Nocardioides bruguierae TaxID=2945102 RepID=A0A9X2IEW6_9ACTN|nr:GNAT family N-acetyltransferase [Nocardioides bruguierae]MCM0619045.1 GNAT family N-acetyltransferase [Nocardioides bruguierae]